jgi:hypothetical protein
MQAFLEKRNQKIVLNEGSPETSSGQAARLGQAACKYNEHAFE